ncbi:MAG: GntR family transcriptional regulator [Enterocloster citroniae]|nr:GntR family transcriptional regulator [Enterocloster citroniae]
MSSIPAYRHVYSGIKQKIKNGTYQVGSLLPPEPELQREHSVSRTTIRKAISLLVSEGYLDVRQGKGTQVLDVSTTQSLNMISSVTESFRQKGYDVSTQGMYIERIPAPDFLMDLMKLPKGGDVYHLQRVQAIDGTPIAIMENYLKASLVPGLEAYANGFTGLYSFLESRYNIILKDALESITAIAASFTDSQILGIRVGTPLLQTKRITYTEQDCIEYAITKLVADKYEYSVYLHGRP